MKPGDLFTRAAELASSHTPFVTVTLIEAVGSTPADTGAKMLVTDQGLDMGTIGGGRVEAIRRQDGRWVVVTSKGLILAAQ